MKNVYVFAFLAYAGFSFTDASVKASGGHLGVFETAFVLNVFAGLTLLLTRHPNERWRDFWQTNNVFAVHARAICGVVSSLCGVYAFTTIPLAQAYALIFLAPLFVTLLSATVLGEQVGPWRWTAVFIGFLGVLMVVKPGYQPFQPGHLAAIGCGLGTGMAVIILRKIGGKVKTTSILGTLIAYLLVLNTAVMAFRGFTLPDLHVLVILVIAGICYGLGQWAFVMAARYGNANQIAPIHYSQLCWAVGFGALIFNEYPDPLALFGILVIAAAGLTTIVRERIRSRRPEPPATVVRAGDADR